MTEDQTIQQHLIAEGIIAPPDAQVAAVVAGMLKTMLRTAYSMRLEDADVFVAQSLKLLKEAKKRNDPDLAQYRQGYRVALAYSRFRRDLEKLRPHKTGREE